MNPKTSRLASLLGSASLFAMAGAGALQAQEVAQAQMAQAGPTEVPEQVLVTGSLIRGTAAVGVPVTNLGPQDYAQTGSSDDCGPIQDRACRQCDAGSGRHLGQ